MKHSIKYLQLCQLSFTLYSTVENLRTSKTDYWIYLMGSLPLSGFHHLIEFLGESSQGQCKEGAQSKQDPCTLSQFMAPAISLGQKWQKNTGTHKNSNIFPRNSQCILNSCSLYPISCALLSTLVCHILYPSKELKFRVYSCVSYPLPITKDKKLNFEVLPTTN